MDLLIWPDKRNPFKIPVSVGVLGYGKVQEFIDEDNCMCRVHDFYKCSGLFVVIINPKLDLTCHSYADAWALKCFCVTAAPRSKAFYVLCYIASIVFSTASL